MNRPGALPIAVRNMRKTYGGVCALDDVNLDIRAGEFMTLLGPSGSGKTTLLMILAGFVRPDHGGVQFGETEVVLTPPHRRNIGMVFQNYALFPHMTVAGNIGYPLRVRGEKRGDIEMRVTKALSLVRMEGFGERRIDQLSGGQKQRVALARAIVFEPRILLMDEPLSALDKKLREEMQGEIRRLHEQLEMTTVYVTHDQREALTMSDRIAVINNGQLAQLGTPREIYDRPANAFVADFIGESALLPAHVQNSEAWYGEQKLFVEDDSAADGDYFLLLRPEHLMTTDDNAAVDDNVFSGIIAGKSYQGESMLLQITLSNGTQIHARTAATFDAVSGAAIQLRLRRAHAVLVPRNDT